LAVGSSTLTATYGAISGAASLTVTPAVLTSLALTPANPSIAAGTTQQFKATGTFSDGTKQDVTPNVIWASGTPAVATIDAAGLASGLTAGASTISATSGAISASTTLTVTSATLVSLAVTPGTATIAVTTGQQFKATGTFSDGSTQDLSTQATWNSSAPSVATVDTKGFASGLAAGGASITATFGAASGSAILTVTSATLVSLAVTPANGTVAVGGTKQFTATGTFSDASTQNLSAQVAWSSSNTAAASINGTGLATGLASGTTSIQAAFGAVSGGTFLTVTPAGATLVSIAVTPANPSAIVGAAVQFTATGAYSDGSTLDLSHAVTWTSSNGAVALLSSSGLATTLGAGTSTIKAALGLVSGSTTLTVVGVTLQSITVTPANPTLALTTQQQFTATGHYNDGSTADLTGSVTWASVNSAVAGITPGGLATALAAGTSTIQATQGAITGSTTLTVTSATLVSLAVTPLNPVIPAGTAQQFHATGTFSDSSTQDLTLQVGWSSSNTAAATISTTGLASGLAKGITTIQATFGAISASTSLAVSATSAPLVAVVVTPAAPSIAAGTTQPFIATGVFSDTSTQDLTAASAWASSAPAVATVDGSGLATALTAGTSTLSATANGITGNATLTVTTATLSSIAVTPVSPSLAAGTGLQFTATGTFSDGSTQNLTSLVAWSSSNGAAATISTTGFASGLAGGSTTITATLGLVSGSTTLTITNATLASISVSPVDPSIAKGTTQAFLAEGLFSDGSKQDLTAQVAWSSSLTSVATVDSTGLATGLGTGTTTITATFGALSGSTTLTVTPATLLSIGVTPPTASAPAGIGVSFSATGIFSDGTSQDLTALVGWTSSDTSVAVVDPAGLATGLATGNATITATLGSVSGGAAFTVTAATLVSINLDPTDPFLPLGSQQQMTATGVYSDGTNLDITSQAVWTSSTPAVAQVDPSGLVTTPSGSIAGTTTVTATLSGVSGSTTVTVTAATLTSISVFGNTPLGVGTTDNYTATGIYSDGSSVDLTAQAVWTSSDAAIATVDNAPLNSGTVTAIGAGTATITATFGGVSGSASVTVTAATLTSITVTPASQTIAVSTTLQYTATGNYSDGSIQDLTTLVAWASSNPAVAGISGAAGTEGLATGLSGGSTTISASLGGVIGSTDLTVTAATLVSIAVTPANSSLPRGFTQPMVATATFSDGSTQDVTTQATWSSSNTTVAVISNALGNEGVVTALATGTATLTATLNGVSGSTGLTVTNVVLVSIAVTPANRTLKAGRSLKYTATGTFSDGSTKKITTQVTWTSSDPTIARINASKKGGAGKCYALSPGTVTITATKPPSGGQPAVSGSTTLTVN
ncbi:MAG TPA: Ig-like domain-containing protein, partial [Holophagaceae bacterium]|nr:Ig-like domain-containing protein [Holophagaceae bacterium]